MESDLKVFQLPPSIIPNLWGVIEPYVKSGAERSSGRLTVENLYGLLTAGTWQCWTVWEGADCLAAIITKLAIESSGQRTLSALIASGRDREKWERAAVERLKEFAREEGCGLFDMMARPGWHKVFPEFEKTHVLLEWRVA